MNSVQSMAAKPKNFIDELFAEEIENSKLLGRSTPAKYYTLPEMAQYLKNKTGFIQIDGRWTCVKFILNGQGGLQFLIL